jgi:hypothetical protein
MISAEEPKWKADEDSITWGVLMVWYLPHGANTAGGTVSETPNLKEFYRYSLTLLFNDTAATSTSLNLPRYESASQIGYL